jgi:hypothetical protein
MSHFNEHKLIHSSIKKIYLSLESMRYEFYYIKKLNLHISNIHLDEKSLKFQIIECQKKFENLKNLKTHEKQSQL